MLLQMKKIRSSRATGKDIGLRISYNIYISLYNSVYILILFLWVYNRGWNGICNFPYYTDLYRGIST